MRVLALYMLVFGLSIYAWRDWFVSLCGLILMMAFMNRSDMPRTMFGIQGLSVWNALFLVVCLAWAASRRREGLQWDLPHHISVLLWLTLGVILFGFLRAVLDRGNIESYPLESLVSEELINTVKWVLPAFLLFDGCRTRRRVILAVVCIVFMYLLISVLVIKRMPIEAVYSYSERVQHARLKLNRTVGYHCVDASAFLAGAFWALIALLQLLRGRIWQIAGLAAAGMVLFAQALTGGRAGYLAWGATGLTMVLLKWRRHLILAPLIVMLLPILFPGPTERMLRGFGQTDAAGEAVVDREAISSGRLLVWPYVIEEIERSPWIGYGRLAMKRTGLSRHVGLELDDDSWPHPHNMYLETLLDNGIFGSLPILAFWGIMALYSARLFRSSNRLYSGIGGAALALTLCQLFAGVGSQHFYPRESTLGVYAAMFLMLRVYVEEKRMQIAIDLEPAAGSVTYNPQRMAVASSHVSRGW